MFDDPLSLLLIGWGMMALLMAFLWIVQLKTGDAGIVDVAWGTGVGILAVFYAWRGDGDEIRRYVVGALALGWSLRLSSYILKRVLQMPEDGRYQTLKEGWGEGAQRKMFRFYQFQAIGAVLFAVPMLLASRNQTELGVLDIIGCFIWWTAVMGEGIADKQLADFRMQSENKGKVCQRGLWRYSRHPNYFFEWMHWWSYVCFAWFAPWGWLSIGAPLAMLYFIFFVTGIPPTEAQAIKSRGDAYREYQRTTSAFFPWPPKASAGE